MRDIQEIRHTKSLTEAQGRSPRLVVVTASADIPRLERFADVTRLCSSTPDSPPPIVAVLQKAQDAARVYSGMVARTADYLGVVPAFAQGVQLTLMAYPHAEVIACLHDDCLIAEQDWDAKVLELFDQQPKCGLAGFGGAWGLGDEQAGHGQYRPTWLVRRGFMSNMQDAETHGVRVRTARPVACLDGFSQIFRRRFLTGYKYAHDPFKPGDRAIGTDRTDNLFSLLQHWGVMHHAYDAATGAFAKQLGWDTWLLPLACQHLGGQTAVGDSAYGEWAMRQTVDGKGDARFWEEAHSIVWCKLGHLLPFEVARP